MLKSIYKPDAILGLFAQSIDRQWRGVTFTQKFDPPMGHENGEGL